MTRYSLITYKRIHQNEHPTDIEQGKIRRETSTYVRRNREALHLAERLLKTPDDESLLERFEISERQAAKEYRNAKGHKRRLKDLYDQGLE